MKNQAVVVVVVAVAVVAAAVAALFWRDYFSLEFVSHETWNSDGSISLVWVGKMLNLMCL